MAETPKSRRKMANPVKFEKSVETLKIKAETLPDELTPESDDFVAQFHNNQTIDNCDFYGRHLERKSTSRKPLEIATTHLNQLHLSSVNYTEPKAAPFQIRPLPAGLKTQPVAIKRIPISKPITVTKSNLKSLPILNLSQGVKLNNTVEVKKTNLGNGVQLVPDPGRVSTAQKPSFKVTQPSVMAPVVVPEIPSVPLSEEEMLNQLREKAVAIKTCMKLTMEEVEALVLGGKVVRVVSNRKKPDQSLKYPCKFCIYFHHDSNGEVKQRSFGRKEEIKRHHMLHLRYERFQCQYCPYKVVRSDHLHRHMKNKHPDVDHPGPQSNRRKQLMVGESAFALPEGDTSARFPGMEYDNSLLGTTVYQEDEDDDDEFMSNLTPKSPLPISANSDDTALTAETIQALIASGVNLQSLIKQADEAAKKSEQDESGEELVIAEDNDIQCIEVKSELPDEEPEVKRIKFN